MINIDTTFSLRDFSIKQISSDLSIVTLERWDPWSRN